jgi:beta-galactosidase
MKSKPTKIFRTFLIRSLLIIGLPTIAAADWKPAPDSILTEWGEKVTPDSAWQAYPRPAFRRDNWTNLNGLWDYAITPGSRRKPPPTWDGKILVPFPIESALSGVKKRISPDDAIWYHRKFTAKLNPGKSVFLNFEAVDYSCTVWVNGEEVGQNVGGNLPFSFEITGALVSGKNTITLRVTDATDSAYQLHGKQVSEPRGIWYTPVSGIWQTVWMEERPMQWINDLKVTTTTKGDVRISALWGGTLSGRLTLHARVLLDGKVITEGKVNTPELKLNLKIPDPQLWSPDSPTLYDMELTLGSDKVASYFGIRETSVVRDKQGHLRFHLNGKPIFHWGTLDQGWWPDGLLTPPSDAAMRSDIEFLKASGFNTVRKHIKVEPRRYYTHCDRLGILVYQDQVSSGTGRARGKKGSSAVWTRLQPDPVDAIWPDAAHKQFMKELELMIDTLHNHPSIVQWVPFNEAWGQHRTMKVGEWTVKKDPTRQINIASGGNFFPVGHVVDHHQYPHPGFPFELGKDGRFDDYVKVVGEFGGHGYPVKGHLWDPNARNWGYGGLPKNKEEWVERYQKSLQLLAELKSQGIAGGIYTQTTDVEGEINGLITYDRKVRKIDPIKLRQLADELLSAPNHFITKTVLPTSEQEGQIWQYTTTKPAKGWTALKFDDSSWKKGSAGFGTKITPRTHVRTVWDTNEIWIRRRFEAPDLDKGSLFLRVYHDEDAEVFLNGNQIANLAGFNGRYSNVAIPTKHLRTGSNVLAIHCRQTIGGQYIDAGLIRRTPHTNNSGERRRRGTQNPKRKQSQLIIPKAQVAPVAPVMGRNEIEAGLKSHDRALFIKNDWIRDPYITLGPDDFYYLTGTTINEEDPHEETDPYNIGLGEISAVGNTVRVWKSKDLIDWEYLGTPYTLEDSSHANPGDRIWAPEIHWIPGMNRWALVHCPKPKSVLALSNGPSLKGPWTHPFGRNHQPKHDPSLYKDGETWWMLSENTNVQPLASDFSSFTAPPIRIDPSGQRTGPDGKRIRRIGHEGATMIKIGDQYVHLGTAWSTDRPRQGSYNLYYCTSKQMTGPFGPRKFAGRFLGHGTPFQTRDGKWWCTAFFNANVPPLSRKGIRTRDLSKTAQTINRRGTTIVPLKVRLLKNGEIFIRAIDPDYANPGPDESQTFSLE